MLKTELLEKTPRVARNTIFGNLQPMCFSPLILASLSKPDRQ